VKRRLSTLAVVAALLFTLVARPPAALANGAASTRNIILGGAALTAGTLILLNRNKKVHQKYAEYDRRQAATQAQANQSEGAYQSERQAYNHEASLVSDLEKTIVYQHGQVTARNREIAALKHSLVVAKYGASRPVAAAAVAPAIVAAAARPVAPAARVDHRVLTRRATPPANVVSYGWGSY